MGADDLEMSWRHRALGFQLAIAETTFVAHSCGGNFDSIGREQKAWTISESDQALVRELARYYGTALPSPSKALWETDIFAPAFASARRS